MAWRIGWLAICMSSTAVLAAPAGANAPASMPSQAGPTDASITRSVRAQLADAAPGARYVTVETRNGIVTLAGRVDSEGTRERVVSLAIATDGVAAVNDQLVVVPRPPAASPP